MHTECFEHILYTLYRISIRRVIEEGFIVKGVEDIYKEGCRILSEMERGREEGEEDEAEEVARYMSALYLLRFRGEQKKLKESEISVLRKEVEMLRREVEEEKGKVGEEKRRADEAEGQLGEEKKRADKEKRMKEQETVRANEEKRKREEAEERNRPLEQQVAELTQEITRLIS